MNDTTSSLFEHLKNRLATGYGYGDDGQTITDKIPDHRTSNQSIREDHEGDVGIFEYMIRKQPSYDGIDSHTLWITNVQISVVTKQGNIEDAKDYLLESFRNFISDAMSSNVYVKNASLINIIPAGKNSKGLQMVIMNTQVFYYINKEE